MFFEELGSDPAPVVALEIVGVGLESKFAQPAPKNPELLSLIHALAL